MATNPLPPDSENLTVNVPRGFKKRLKAQAKASGVTVSEYVRALIQRALDQGLLVHVSREVSYHTSKFAPTGTPPESIPLAAAEHPAPYLPPIKKKMPGSGGAAPSIPNAG